MMNVCFRKTHATARASRASAIGATAAAAIPASAFNELVVREKLEVRGQLYIPMMMMMF